MLNFYGPFLCRILAAILKMTDILKIFENAELPKWQLFCISTAALITNIYTPYFLGVMK
jgi:hypothetical protein